MTVATQGDMVQDMDLIHRALTSARIYVAGHDQADSIRRGSDKVAYSALRTLLEQAEKAAAHIVERLTPPTDHDPCYLPPTNRDGGSL